MVASRRTLAVGLLAFALAVAPSSGALADDTADGFVAGTLYLADANSLEDLPEGSSLAYDAPLVGLPAPGDPATPFPNAAGATGVFAFVSPQGSEADPTTWNSYEGFGAPLPTGLSLPPLTPLTLLSPGTGSPSGNKNVQSAGGDYSLGVAFTTDNGATVVDHGLYFVHIYVTPGNGDFTWQTIDPAAVVVGSPTGGGAAGGGDVAAGMLSFTASTGGGTSTVKDGRTGAAGWTVVVGVGEDARTFSSGTSGDVDVDLPDDTSGAVTVTLVSG